MWPFSMRPGICRRRAATHARSFAPGGYPGAQFFDIEELSDTTSPYPHMLPRAEKFSSRMRKLGVGDGKKVIVYDTLGIYSAARAWWMFRVFGKDDVAVLDGGLKKWKAEGKPVEDGPPIAPQERHFTARFRSTMVRDRSDVLGALQTGADADRRCALGCPLRRRRARAAGGGPRRAHAGREEPAVFLAHPRRRHACTHRPTSRRSSAKAGIDPDQTDHNLLRIGNYCRGPEPRPRAHRLIRKFAV